MTGTTTTLIVGAGFAGIGTAIRLLQEGTDDFVILERSNRVGGTWRDNTYPGAACDIPSLLYSYSFEPNPAGLIPTRGALRSSNISTRSSPSTTLPGSSSSIPM